MFSGSTQIGVSFVNCYSYNKAVSSPTAGPPGPDHDGRAADIQGLMMVLYSQAASPQKLSPRVQTTRSQHPDAWPSERPDVHSQRRRCRSQRSRKACTQHHLR